MKIHKNHGKSKKTNGVILVSLWCHFGIIYIWKYGLAFWIFFKFSNIFRLKILAFCNCVETRVHPCRHAVAGKFFEIRAAPGKTVFKLFNSKNTFKNFKLK